jgi:hypothetical protein
VLIFQVGGHSCLVTPHVLGPSFQTCPPIIDLYAVYWSWLTFPLTWCSEIYILFRKQHTPAPLFRNYFKLYKTCCFLTSDIPFLPFSPYALILPFFFPFSY